MQRAQLWLRWTERARHSPPPDVSAAPRVAPENPSPGGLARHLSPGCIGGCNGEVSSGTQPAKAALAILAGTYTFEAVGGCLPDV
jgi:hypothetical protein